MVVVTHQSTEALDRLGPVWYYTYGFWGADLPGHQRLFMVRPNFSEERLLQALSDHRAEWWILGNEPNDPHQDDLSPGTYAAFYHRVEGLIGRVDPKAHVTPAGISNADWRWAEAFRESYREQHGRYPRVDAWNIHDYVLEPDRDQLDVAEFQRRIIAFRTWMEETGERDKPLFLTEFGALFGSGQTGRPAEDPERVVAYMQETVEWLRETDYVQSYSWFADFTKGQFGGDLYDSEARLTPYGVAYRRANGWSTP